MGFTTVVKVEKTDGTLPILTLLAGNRHDDKARYDEIKSSCRLFGIGKCTNKCKPVELYVCQHGNIFGLSTILDYRYFDLWRV
jgi:hypothetical protein